MLLAFAAAPLCAQTYTDLYEFNCTTSTGCLPGDNGHLVQWTDGNLYGTTTGGGTFNHGTIFKVSTTGVYSDVYDFTGTTDGYAPAAALTMATLDGNLYGTTIGGGAFNNGVLFRFNPTTSTFTVLHNFTAAESSPLIAPVEAKDFNLYGTAQSGATYRLRVKTGTYQPLPNLAPNVPNSPLYVASDGFMYGTSQLGGVNNLGTVYRMNTKGNIQVIHSFDGSDGSEPRGSLVQAGPSLWGTTYFQGGVADAGTIFQISLSPPFLLTTVHVFDNTDGDSPTAGITAASNGNLYGTTTYGGTNLVGTIFQVSGGVFSHLFDFADPGDTGVSGAYPYTTLVEDTNGLLYGLTNGGGANFDGVFYSLTVPSFTSNITLCCNWWLILDQPVTILGQGLTGVVSVQFGSVQARFQPGSDTYLTAFVPSTVIDAPVTVTLATGLQLQSQQSTHVLPKITNLDPSSGAVGTQVNIVGGGFAGTTSVAFGGVPTGNFVVVTPAMIQATVPAGAKTGKVEVITPNGAAASTQIFTVN